MRRIFKSGTFWFALLAAAIVVAGTASSVFLWPWLHPQGSPTASNSETVRNLGFLIGGALAFLFALWRGWVAERQAGTAHRQAEIAQQQAATAERGLLNERYQKGVEALASTTLPERLGAIYELQRLADEHPEQYHVAIMRRFCDIVCNPIGNDGGVEGEPLNEELPARKDVRVVMEAIGTRNDDKIALERHDNYRLDLSDADLRGHYLHNLNLSGSLLTSAKLSNTYIFGTDLSGAGLYLADLCGASIANTDFTGTFLAGANLSRIRDCHGTKFSNANLTGANLTDGNLSGAIVNGAELLGANLAGTKFWDETGMMVEGLTQKQIAFARATPEEKPPQLEGLEDADTGELISWDKRPKVV